jgi:3'(2'), 5'-bisphosphate nucleotidase
MNAYSQYLPSLLTLAKEAGDAILEVYHSASPDVQQKSDNSPLTKADLASHHIIVDGLSKLTPDIPILSEEASDIAYEVRSQWKTYWLIDPLDGTKEFINRNGEFTVNIALIDNKEPVLGVVYVPVKGEFYYASKGDGAFSALRHSRSSLRHSRGGGNPEISSDDTQSTPINVAQREAVGEVRVVVSRSHAGPETQAYLQKLEADGFTINALSIGSSLKLCYVANGTAHVYPRFGPTMEWDTAAGHAVLVAAGGSVSTLEGAPLAYGKAGFRNPHFLARGRRG